MMTKNYTTQSNYTNNLIFGGKITNYSFDGYTTMSDIASQIMSDWRFDEQCRKNVENRNKKKTIAQKGAK
jgi:hypothetical protein